MALTRLPFEDRLPKPGDVAEIVVVDLGSGETRRVADTRGWDVQLGAQLQWGADDHSLFFNDLEVGSWQPFGVRLDPLSGARKRLDGTSTRCRPTAAGPRAPACCGWPSRSAAMAWSCRVTGSRSTAGLRRRTGST
jgi:hypothetical protein